MFKGNEKNIPCKADFNIKAWLPNVFELWRMDIKTDKHNHEFKGITFFGLRLAIKTRIGA